MTSEGIIKVTATHPEGGMNVCTEFHGNPSNSCWHVSTWTKAVDSPIYRAALLAWLKMDILTECPQFTRLFLCSCSSAECGACTSPFLDSWNNHLHTHSCMKNISTYTRPLRLTQLQELLAVAHLLHKQHCDCWQRLFTTATKQTDWHLITSLFLSLSLSLSHTHTHIKEARTISCWLRNTASTKVFLLFLSFREA